MSESLLLAVGGNSLIHAGQLGTMDEQAANASRTAECIAALAERGCRLVITHGNGPQVGAQLLRQEAAFSKTYPVPLDVCVAMTQGEIGYVLQRSIESALAARGLHIPVVALITQVLVRKGDPAFLRPTKPVGPFYDKATAHRKQTECGWNMIEDNAHGFRRVVPCPAPQGIVELDAIRECLGLGFIVIAGGGGGVPVVEEDHRQIGVEAVIDKDHTSALLASALHLDRMIILTEVESVYLNYNQPDQKAITSMSIESARRHLLDNDFTEGSMKPKIEAAIKFLSAGGKEVIITNPEHLIDALDGDAGTHLTKSGASVPASVRRNREPLSERM